MNLGLQGKRALVTGSSSGIGAGIAKTLAAEGVSVVVHGRNVGRVSAVVDEIRQRDATAVAVIGDLASEDGAAAVAEAAASEFGGIDILVNNAGGPSDTEVQSWFALPVSEWGVTYQRNVLSAGYLIHALAPAMKENRWGRIIQIASAAGIIPTSGQPDYGPSKAAMINMSMGLSKALAGSGVTVNTVMPGMIMTKGLRDFLRVFAERRGWGDDLDRAAQYVLKGTGQTVHRIGQVDDVAYAVAMLASPKADFFNGMNLHVDGGGTSSIY
ncbi:SDR family NAD(P)-dependent oxidoreductase [Mycobacterium branderi]|uniref:3-oxoacyl-[acyl-carrier-protein] reductase MabA n=1 Tax=Mycobacterium branderi TaxID=43348 RepID=A0A7I7WFJ6_9MYCO|nr:SDR family NAD(P)-dependent oxidoreductase [Mycobacterium branderi]MCV7231792.1 SDR family NAD(P)-dependent oxidoreductase [Mycobacterium branderi]ORA40249.1 3-oxoacyl-ACP reductase [Mycobacterium branderi]BBZ15555.1 3-oxoacyl-ACP reductase [Mycobacterium branderi]